MSTDRRERLLTKVVALTDDMRRCQEDLRDKGIERRVNIKALREHGVSARAIAEVMGTSATTIYNELEKE
jgi:IS30 family transposase